MVASKEDIVLVRVKTLLSAALILSLLAAPIYIISSSGELASLVNKLMQGTTTLPLFISILFLILDGILLIMPIIVVWKIILLRRIAASDNLEQVLIHLSKKRIVLAGLFGGVLPLIPLRLIIYIASFRNS